MKKRLLSLFCAVLSVCIADAASFMIDGKEYEYNLLIKKEIGPGVTYHRIRIPDFPLNVNYMVVDLNNPYNRIETQQANERLGSTETLAGAYARHQADGKKPLGGQNGNFWVVGGQGIPSQFAMGATYNANLKNGQIITETNCYSDQWDGGPTRTGVVGIDSDKKLWIESMSWKGYVSSSKWGDGQKHEIIQVNKYCRASGEMTLYNSFYGKDKKFQTIEEVDGAWTTVDNKTCEVYLDLNEGQQWSVGKDFTATVKEVKTNTEAGTLGDYDLCLAGTASYKSVLEQLQPGDVVTINYGWHLYASDEIPELENAIGGNAIVMLNGELTGRNDDEQYNTQIYSRSAYGMSEDGKTLYMLVIDKSLDPVYGNSAGCNTRVMCQIMKQLGAWTVCNVDAGGSAQLMVQGDVVNTTTEGTPRAVANGWMVYSTAPETSESNVISRIEFLDSEINIPVYATYKPVILGYNVYGELIDEDVEGVVLSVDNPAMGTASGAEFKAEGKILSGKITATYGNVSVTKDINIIESEIGMRLSEILIDDRDYEIEIIAKSGMNDFECDPSRLVWTVDDETVVAVENGVLRGLTNGTTKVYGQLGDFSVSANVTVEIPESDYMPVYREFPEEGDWTLKQLGGTGLTISEFENGFKLNYVGNGSSRGAYIEIENPVEVWSLPESLRLRINPGKAIIKSVTVVASNALGNLISPWEISSTELPQNEETEFVLSLSDWCDPNDIGIYPITINKLTFSMGKSEDGEDFEIQIPNFEAYYGNGSGGVTENFTNSEVKVYPNPVSAGRFRIELPNNNEICSVYMWDEVGTMVFNRRFLGSIFDVNVENFQSGMYIIKIVVGDNVYVSKVIFN